jgi:two-component system chemotaxis response regulator CheY
MKILIAEDDFVSRTLITEMLAPYGVCHAATDGQEAMHAFISQHERKSPYNLVCLDIMMPKKTGQEVLQEIRAYEKANGIGGSDAVKVIMTTALSDPKNIMTAFLKGACEGYLTKPIEHAQLEAQLLKLGFAKPRG